jgi:ribonuclease HI
MKTKRSFSLKYGSGKRAKDAIKKFNRQHTIKKSITLRNTPDTIDKLAKRESEREAERLQAEAANPINKEARRMLTLRRAEEELAKQSQSEMSNDSGNYQTLRHFLKWFHNGGKQKTKRKSKKNNYL